jgi:hypothetical protein
MAKKMGLLTNAQTKIMKMNYFKVLNSRVLLYLVLILALCDLFYFAMEKDYLFCGIFILIGFLTSFFSKNMMVVLVIAIALTNILRFGKSSGINEGMEDKQENAAKEEDTTKDEEFENEHSEETHLEGATDAIVDLNSTSKPSESKKTATSKADDTVAGLDEQTANLIQQQKTLMKNMENLTPLLQNAENLMEKFQSLNA